MATTAVEDRLPRFPTRPVILMGASLLIGGWLVAFCFTLWRLHDEALNTGIETAVTHARNFEEHLTQTLQVLDLSAGSIALTNGQTGDLKESSQRLAAMLRPIPFLRAIALLDTSGRILASSNSQDIGVIIDTASFVPAHRPEAEVIRLDRPWKGRDFRSGAPVTDAAPLRRNEDFFIPVLRRINQGNKDYWLAAAISPDYFLSHFAKLLDPGLGSVSILHHDGVMLLSSGGSPASGAPEALADVTSRMATEKSGKFMQALPDGQESLVAFHASNRFPVAIAVYVDKAQALARWQVEARKLALIGLPLLFSFGVACALVWRWQLRLVLQQQELERQRKLAASAFDASSDTIMTTTPDGSIVSVNPAFERITGYTEAEVLGRKPGLLASGKQDRHYYHRMWSALITDGHWHGEIVNRRKDGGFYTGLIHINAVKDASGGLLHYVAVTTDISERKRHEEALLDAKTRAEAAALAKASFLATISHEIRTPMNGVLGMVEVLLLSTLGKEQRENLEFIKLSTHSLLGILNEIIDYSRVGIDNAVLEAVPFDPAKIVGDVIGLFKSHAREKGLQLSSRLDSGLPHTVVGDPTRLRQILGNLVSNGIKFTPAGHVVVEATAELTGTSGQADADACLLRFAVTDTGIGIPFERQEMIFDAFSQTGGSTSRAYGGTGLGLTISRRLAQAMGGDITVKSAVTSAVTSEPGQGSCFTATVRVQKIVIAPVDLAQHRPLPTAAAAESALKLLLVEDLRSNQVLLGKMLQALGHTVQLAGNGAEGVAAIDRERFDAVFMDVRMPVMDGLVAARAIRAREARRGGHVPIIALTANAFDFDRDACLAAGMDDFLSKPASLNDLKAALDRIKRS